MYIDSGLKELSMLSRLRELDLRGVEIDDDGLKLKAVPFETKARMHGNQRLKPKASALFFQRDFIAHETRDGAVAVA